MSRLYTSFAASMLLLIDAFLVAIAPSWAAATSGLVAAQLSWLPSSTWFSAVLLVAAAACAVRVRTQIHARVALLIAGALLGALLLPMLALMVTVSAAVTPERMPLLVLLVIATAAYAAGAPLRNATTQD